VVQHIIDTIHSEGGRFLKPLSSGCYLELTAQQRKDKIAHAIRDMMSTQDAKKKEMFPRDVKTYETTHQLSKVEVFEEKNKHKTPFSKKTQQDIRSPETATTSPVQLQAMKSRRLGSAPDRATLASSYPKQGAENESINERIHIEASLDRVSQANTEPINSQRFPQSIQESASLKSTSPESGNDSQFLDAINDTLGPLQPDATDPIEAILAQQSSANKKTKANLKKPPQSS
jgi:hypothetical protein